VFEEAAQQDAVGPLGVAPAIEGDPRAVTTVSIRAGRNEHQGKPALCRLTVLITKHFAAAIGGVSCVHPPKGTWATARRSPTTVGPSSVAGHIPHFSRLSWLSPDLRCGRRWHSPCKPYQGG